MECHPVGQDREAGDGSGSVAQPVVMIMCYHDPFHALPLRGEVRPGPSHVPGSLADDAVSGMAAL